MKKLLTLLMAVGLVAAAAAPAAARNDSVPKGQARVRVVHASPDAPPVDILVNGTIRAFSNVKSGDVTGYATLPAGVYDFAIVPTGGGLGSAVMVVPGVNLSYYGNYTVVALNTLANFEVLPLVDTNVTTDALLYPGAARLRFLHASPDAPAVDVKVAGGPFLYKDVAFKQVGDYLLVPAGMADVEVRLAGTDAVVLTVPGVKLKPGNTYTAYATGFALGGQPRLSVVLSKDAGLSSDNRGSRGQND